MVSRHVAHPALARPHEIPDRVVASKGPDANELPKADVFAVLKHLQVRALVDPERRPDLDGQGDLPLAGDLDAPPVPGTTGERPRCSPARAARCRTGARSRTVPVTGPASSGPYTRPPPTESGSTRRVAPRPRRNSTRAPPRVLLGTLTQPESGRLAQSFPATNWECSAAASSSFRMNARSSTCSIGFPSRSSISVDPPRGACLPSVPRDRWHSVRRRRSSRRDNGRVSCAPRSRERLFRAERCSPVARRLPA